MLSSLGFFRFSEALLQFSLHLAADFSGGILVVASAAFALGLGHVSDTSIKIWERSYRQVFSSEGVSKRILGLKQKKR